MSIGKTYRTLHEPHREILREKEEGLCKEDTCPLINSCSEEPHYGCLEYRQKESCAHKETLCASSELVCIKKEPTCVNQVEICVQYDENNNCMRTQRDCKYFTETCVEWGYRCVGDTYETCEVNRLLLYLIIFKEFEMVQEEGNCVNWGWTCNQVAVADPECISECQAKEKEISEKRSKNI